MPCLTIQVSTGFEKPIIVDPSEFEKIEPFILFLDKLILALRVVSPLSGLATSRWRSRAGSDHYSTRLIPDDVTAKGPRSESGPIILVSFWGT